jgi:hypothetical protein
MTYIACANTKIRVGTRCTNTKVRDGTSERISRQVFVNKLYLMTKDLASELLRSFFGYILEVSQVIVINLNLRSKQ